MTRRPGRRGRLLLALLPIEACAPAAKDSRVEVHDSGSDTASDTADSGHPLPDEALLRSLLEDPDPSPERIHDVLGRVALSEGMPSRTSEGTWIFCLESASGSWNLAGDFDGWAGRPMERRGRLHWAELEIEDPLESAYKFWDGSESWIADPWARRFNYDTYGEISYVQASRAHLERWPGLAGRDLQSRTVRAWVPEGGVFDRVLFVHDGQNLFDPEAFWGGWRLQESLPENMLVLGVDNTPDRMEEYTHVEDLLHGAWVGGWGDRYAEFLELDLRPFFVERYGDAHTWGLMGSSLGGLISLHIADRHPGAYDFAASLSGTLGWGSIGATNETLIERLAAAGHRDTSIYLDSGGLYEDCADRDGDGIHDDDEASSDNVCETFQMRDALADVGYAYEVDLWHWWEPGAAHDEAAWAERVWRPLQIFHGL
jgi:hypothetical protein